MALLCISYLEVEDVKKESKEYKKEVEKLKQVKKDVSTDKSEDIEKTALVKFLEQNKVRTFISALGGNASIDFEKQTANVSMMYAAIYIKNSPSSISLSEINNYLKLYGIVNTSYPNIPCSIDNTYIYQYDDSNQTYNFVGSHDHGSMINVSEPVYIKPLSLKKKNGSYILTTNEVYIDENVSANITADVEGKQGISDIQSYKKEDGSIDYSKLIIDYENNYKKDKYQKYEYTFKKDKSSSFYLSSYKKA